MQSMTNSAQAAPATYQVRIAGHLDPHWSAWFDGIRITHAADGTTLLVGLLVDQAALFGLLGTVRDLHLTLLSVQRVIDLGTRQ